MKIKEICEKTGLTERAVRLYLERGLLHPASERRRGRTYYEYSEADLARLREIAALRGRGFSLEEIALLLDAGDADAILASRIAALKEEAGQAAENADALGQLAGKAGRTAFRSRRRSCGRAAPKCRPTPSRISGGRTASPGRKSAAFPKTPAKISPALPAAGGSWPGQPPRCC